MNARWLYSNNQPYYFDFIHIDRCTYNFQTLNSARFTHLRKGHKSNITSLHCSCFTVYYIGIKSNVCASFLFFSFIIFILSAYNTVIRLMVLLLHFTFSSVPNIAIVPSVCCEVDFDIVCSALSFWRFCGTLGERERESMVCFVPECVVSICHFSLLNDWKYFKSHLLSVFFSAKRKANHIFNFFTANNFYRRRTHSRRRNSWNCWQSYTNNTQWKHTIHINGNYWAY